MKVDVERTASRTDGASENDEPPISSDRSTEDQDQDETTFSTADMQVLKTMMDSRIDALRTELYTELE